MSFHGINHLMLVIRHPSPAGIDDMPALVSRLWSRKGFMAMTVFGYIFTGNQRDADRLNASNNALKNHEMIHLRQAQSTHNSWVLFYLRYFWYSLLACRYRKKLRNASYYLNPFEIEAYTEMHNLHYLDHCREQGAREWRRYARMSLSQRLSLVRSLGIV